jgi:hypothetical protein
VELLFFVEKFVECFHSVVGPLNLRDRFGMLIQPWLDQAVQTLARSSTTKVICIAFFFIINHLRSLILVERIVMGRRIQVLQHIFSLFFTQLTKSGDQQQMGLDREIKYLVNVFKYKKK